MSPRTVDNHRVRTRHIVRATSSDPGAVEVLPGQWWAPAPGTGIEGRQGWQQAQVERRVSDHGTMSLSLPNGPGDDGRMHRDRFAVRTDPGYRLGEEWVEFVDADSHRPLFVGTPSAARVDGSTVGVSGVDAGALLNQWREGKVAPWVPTAPGDVIDWYSQAPQQVVAQDFAASGLGGWALSNTNGGTATITDAGAVLTRPTTPTSTAELSLLIPSLIGATNVTGWRVAFDYTTSVANQAIRAEGNSGGTWPRTAGTTWFVADLYGTTAELIADNGTTNSIVRPAAKPHEPGRVYRMEVTRIGRWLLLTEDGELLAQTEFPHGGPGAPLAALRVTGSQGATTTVKRAEVSILRSLLRRSAPAMSPRVAGAPTPGGLRGDYFLCSQAERSSVARFRATAPAPLQEPYTRRLDPQMAFAAGSMASWVPPGPASNQWFGVRWSGSIYLDLATSDRRLWGSVGTVSDHARVWVGRTTGAPYMEWTSAGLTGPNLRAHLGTSEAGWYPIVIEWTHGTGIGGFYLRDNPVGGTFPPATEIPASRLSPYGCWSGEVGGESHREIIDQVCAASGLRWRIQPRTLESGEFPGRLEAGPTLGRATDYVIGEDEATEYASEVEATETVDRIHADAAGLGDNMGREGLTADILTPDVTDRPWVATRGETLQEITEQAMLRQRLDSLLALYSTPMETVAARPRGQQVLTDTFPTTGSASLFDWEPDDGVRLDLPSIGVRDESVRRITGVTWPLTPDGRGAPSVGFRQRPRHLRAQLARMARQQAIARRRYQGQLTELAGSLGAVSTFAPEAFTRLNPGNHEIVRLAVRVNFYSGSAGVIEVTGVSTGIAVDGPGEVDVTPWARRFGIDGPLQVYNQYARITPAPTNYIIQLVATVRI